MSEASHIVCGHCGQTNRVAAGRPAERARCGSCREPLFAGHPVEVDQAGFERHAKGNDIPVLVDVWAPWCGPCRAMAPMFERAAGVLEPGVRLLKLNSDRAPELSARLGIRSIPTLLLMRSGRILARSFGAMNSDQIVVWTRSLALAWFVSPYWLLLTAFVGFNLMQSAFTGFCPAATVFRKLGLREGCAFTKKVSTA